jgi:uncharacterized membrane protein
MYLRGLTEQGWTGNDVGVAVVLQVAAVIWFGVLVAGPALVSQPSGSVWHPVGLAVYGIAQWICHQRVERSFELAGVPLPVCARCAGIYGGGAVVALAATVGANRGGVSVRPPAPANRARWVLLVGAAPTALSVASEWAGRAPLSNGLRALAGALLGLTVGWVLFVMSTPSEAGPRSREVADRMG